MTPKDPDVCTVVALLDAFADPELAAQVRDDYRRGGLGYGQAKKLLGGSVQELVAPMRDRYERLLADPRQLDTLLESGEAHARERAARTLTAIEHAMGL
jgi:tryptophanyl-tRNA synthetase